MGAMSRWLAFHVKSTSLSEWIYQSEHSLIPHMLEERKALTL